MKITEQKHLAILLAAEREFITFGYHQARMDRIAESAKVSKRTVYSHFESKEKLFKEIFKQLLEKMSEPASYPYSPSIAIEEQLYCIAQAEVALLCSAEFIELANVIFIELARMPTLKSQMVDALPGCEETLIIWLDAAEKDNKIRVDDKLFAAQQFIFAIKSFVFYPQLFGWQTPDKERIEFILKENISMFLARYAVKNK